ncbi:ArnT family glycosyltransferase [Gayadomonas joobiniege]|uniref:ArnT family glycosyltransferase n=1 Tax=Gayadomonas joobiniege TaxID=1234606 RepID=UPI00037A2D1F|nr:glycosyltransferase family 39 protein [Gayadomonas joobiniege]
MRQTPNFVIVFAIILIIFGYREWVTLSLPVTLFYDEAYYLSWASTPDWGYYSKPPMVAWLIALTTYLFGMAEWAVKLAAPLLYCGTGLLLYLINQKLFSAKAGLMATLIFITMPLVSLNSLFITTDAPQLFFWALCCYAFIRAEQSNLWRWWLLAGMAGGAGLLSKYTFILLPVAFLLLPLFYRPAIKVLQNPRFWLACLIALICLLPNLWWNYQHDFISFQHTQEISKQTENGISITRMGEFLALQLLVFGPLTLILLVKFIFRKNKTYGEHLLWALCWPTILLIAVQALTGRANMNWAAAAYVAASLLVGYQLSLLKQKFWMPIVLLVNIILMVAFYHYESINKQLDIELTASTDPYKRIKGWPDFVQQFQPWFDQYPNHKLAADSRKLLAYFGYYLNKRDFQGVAFDGTKHIAGHYELKYPLANSPKQKFLFVTEDWDEIKLKTYFANVTLLTEQQLPVYKNFTRTARLYQVSGFKNHEQ